MKIRIQVSSAVWGHVWVLADDSWEHSSAVSCFGAFSDALHSVTGGHDSLRLRSAPPTDCAPVHLKPDLWDSSQQQRSVLTHYLSCWLLVTGRKMKSHIAAWLSHIYTHTVTSHTLTHWQPEVLTDLLGSADLVQVGLCFTQRADIFSTLPVWCIF